MIVHRGGCHCGRVRFEVDAPSEIEVLECSCSMCRRLGYLHLIVPQQRFRLISGSDSLRRYAFHTRTARHLFCGSCGVESFYVPRSHPEGYSVNARCLDPGTVTREVRVPFDGADWEAHAHELAPLTRAPDVVPAQRATPGAPTTITIREARPGDVPFLAWVVLAASRSHVARGAWDLAVDGSDAEKLRFLTHLLDSEKPHWCHAGGFLVAEVEGEPAAALSGYAPEDPALVSPAEAIASCARSLGWSDERVGAAFGRLVVFLGCLPPDEPGAWVVEWVATASAHRRRGLVQRLLEAALDRGRERGHAVSQITILSGNDPARRAYERAGYAYVDERRSAAFEEAVGCPGLLRMLRRL